MKKLDVNSTTTFSVVTSILSM